ncbi:DUF551 domain-containing protein [Klebsiella pneumoniae]
MKFEEWLAQQDGVIEVDCGCVTTEAFYHWMRVAYEAGNSPVIPDGWTCNDKANAALMMLDRIETADPVDDDRIDGIKRIVRELVAAKQPQNAPQNIPEIIPGWIPVSERLPEAGGDMIVFTDGIVMSGVSYAKKKGFYIQALEYDDDEPVDSVTHWMPLPAAPQEVPDGK